MNLFKKIKKRREAKGKGERERYTQLNAEFQTNISPSHISFALGSYR